MTPREYYELFRDRWRAVVAGLLLGLLTAAGVVLLTPRQYEASATLFISAGTSTDATGALDRNTLSAERMQTYVQMITSDRVAGEVIETLELPLSGAELAERLDASAEPETVLLTATATDPDPLRAAEIANVLADEFVDQIAEIEQPPDGTAAAVVAARVFEEAVPPTEPTAPRPALTVALGALLGLLAGLGFAVLRRALDTAVRTRRDLARVVAAPVLGETGRRRGAQGPLVVAEDPSGTGAEAYRRLRTNLRFADADRAQKVVLVTAASPGSGTTTVVGNLAMATAELGQRVLVVEADLRRPRAADLLGVPAGAGLTDVLGQGARLGQVVQRGAGGVDVVACGPLVTDPGRLLASAWAVAFLDEARHGYDLVLLDAAPLLPVADAALLAPLVDGVLLVVRAGTPAARVDAARDALLAVPARLLGTVLTMVRGRVSRSDERYAAAAPAHGAGTTPSPPVAPADPSGNGGAAHRPTPFPRSDASSDTSSDTSEQRTSPG